MEDYENLEYDNRWNESGWYESMKSGGRALVGCWAVSGIGVAQGVTRLPVLTASQSALYQTARMTTMIVFTTVFLFMSMMGRWILNMTQFKALTFGTPLRWDQWFFSLIKCNNALQWGGIVKRYCYDPNSLVGSSSSSRLASGSSSCMQCKGGHPYWRMHLRAVHGTTV